jgi:predicted amidophosphoribosyltransferase
MNARNSYPPCPCCGAPIPPEEQAAYAGRCEDCFAAAQEARSRDPFLYGKAPRPGAPTQTTVGRKARPAAGKRLRFASLFAKG